MHYGLYGLYGHYGLSPQLSDSFPLFFHFSYSLSLNPPSQNRTHTKGKGRRKSSAKDLFNTKTNKNQNAAEDMKRQKRYNFYLPIGNHRHAIVAYVKCYYWNSKLQMYVSSTNNLEREHISKLQYASIYPAVKDDLYLNYI